MPILRSAFQPEKQMLSNHPNHPGHPVIQDSSVDALTDDQLSIRLRSENMAKFCTTVSMRSETSDIVELSASNPESPLREQNSDHLFLGEDQELVEVLHSHGCYESEEDLFKRKAIIIELETLVRQWIRSVGLGKGLGWKMVEEAEGRLLTYGSYRLGAVSPDGDIDILCVAPQHVDRNDFFSSLYSLLGKSEDITELRCLSEAFVPVIKMRFKGIEVDLTFASLHCRKIPYDDGFLQYELISQLDPRCQHSLNGYRATLDILDLVPDIPGFLVALRAVKLWAKKNGIYGNILGFPGGFSWALLVVKTCQENQEASPSELVHSFFQSWSSWRWPEPVYIRPADPQPIQAWNPDLNPVDASHCMPIITPTTPQINSTNLVTAFTLQVIRARLLRSLRVCEDIRAGREAWNTLFQAPCFFQEYKDFLLVAGTCEFGYPTWFGLIESQLRHLKDHLEKECGVNAAQIWPIAFKRDDGVSVTRMWFLGVEMQPGHDVGSIQQSIKLFQDLLFAKLYRSNFNNTMRLTVRPVTDRDLKDYISEEEMELPERKKLTYAAVTLGLKEDENTPAPITTVQDLVTSQSAEHLNALQPGVTKTVTIEAPVLEIQKMSLSPKFPAATTAPVGLESGGVISNLAGLFQAPRIPLLTEPGGLYPAPPTPPPTDLVGLYLAPPTPPPTDRVGLYQAPLTPHRIQLANANYLQPSMRQFIGRPTAFTSNHKVKDGKTQTGARDTNQNVHDKDGNKHVDQVPYQNRQISSSSNQKSFWRPHNSSNNNFSRGYLRNAPRGYVKSSTFPSKTSNVNHKPPSCNIDTVKDSPEDCIPKQEQLSDPTSLDNNAKLQITPVATKSTPCISTTSSISIRSAAVNESSGRVPSVPLRTSLPVIPQPNFRVPPPQLQSIPFANSFVVEKRSPLPGRLVGDENATHLVQMAQDTTYLPSNNNHIDIDSERSLSNSESECTCFKGGVRDFDGKERLRSLSNSSDNYSPSNVASGRVTHHLHGPISPMWGVDPLPLVPDMTVPPPSLSVDNCRIQVASPFIENSKNGRPSHPATNSNPLPSFATANTSRQRNNSRSMSQGEIRDALVPRPVNIPKKKNIR